MMSEPQEEFIEANDDEGFIDEVSRVSLARILPSNTVLLLLLLRSVSLHRS